MHGGLPVTRPARIPSDLRRRYEVPESVAEAQMGAVLAQAERCGIALPDKFDVPDRQLWERGYAAEAARSLLRLARALDEALQVVRPFLNPLLNRTASGWWDPRSRGWGGTSYGGDNARAIVHKEEIGPRGAQNQPGVSARARSKRRRAGHDERGSGLSR